MNGQAIFEVVAKHLFAQGCRALGANDLCSYRGPNGTKCAAGALITDDEYDPSMEGWSFGSDRAASIKWPSRLMEHASLISFLQSAHDGAENWRSTDAMKRFLRSVAKNCGLDASVLNDLSFKDR